MMDKFSHVWIMVFMVKLLAFTVQSQEVEFEHGVIRGKDEPLMAVKEVEEYEVCVTVATDTYKVELSLNSDDTSYVLPYFGFEGGLEGGREYCSHDKGPEIIFDANADDEDKEYPGVASVDVNMMDDDEAFVGEVKAFEMLSSQCFVCVAEKDHCTTGEICNVPCHSCKEAGDSAEDE